VGDQDLSHLDENGAARMVDVAGKAATHRTAVAGAVIHMRRETLAMIVEGQVPKGDAFAVARVAGIMAAKKTADLIPLCHPLALRIRPKALLLLPRLSRVRALRLHVSKFNEHVTATGTREKKRNGGGEAGRAHRGVREALTGL